MLAAGAVGLAAALGLAVPATAGAAAGTGPAGIPASTAAQIAALQALKKTETKAESKVDSKLLVERKLRAGRATASAVPNLRTGVAVSRGGTVLVDIRVDKVGDDLLASLKTAGGAVRAISAKEASVRAELPLDRVSALAERGDVRRIEVADQAMTARELEAPVAPSQAMNTNAPTAVKESKEDKAARIGAAVKNAVGAATITSEGDRAHNADTARQQFGVTGVGTKVCALSDGVDSIAASKAKGELPADVDVPAGQEGDGDEGTAMLEILHDVAPGAKLGFATAFNSDASFADNIRALRFQSHCDVLVDDVIYFKESPFQDWIIAQAVNDVTADGALYFSSAGNEGSVRDGTAAHWEGDFLDSGLTAGKFQGSAHNFAGTAGVQVYEPVSKASSAGIPVNLFWSDPLGASANDYDLYLFDQAGNVVSLSQDNQTGTQDPYERLDTPGGGGTGLRIAVVKYSGENRYLSLSALRGRFSDSTDGLKAYNTPGVTLGHSAARQAFSVAATPAAKAFGRPLEPGDPANPVGPFPGTFSEASKVERFSSDGPRRMFYEANGTPITPGNVSSTGGEVRAKPEITAADGVRTSVSGFDPFFGTSAAAPHAAAIAALVLSGNPGIRGSEVRDALVSTAVDIEAPGRDGVSGAGVILADRVLAYTGASPQPLAVARQPIVTSSNGGAYLRPGDTAKVALPVVNDGDGAAVSTNVVLTSTTPGVTIAPRAKSYGTISPHQTGVNDFTVTVPASQPLGSTVVLAARVTFAGSLSPTTQQFALSVGQPSPETRTFAYAGAPVAIPDSDPSGASVPIQVSGIGRAAKLSVSIDGTACTTDAGATTVGIDHSYVNDLTATLTAPDGSKAILLQRNGGSGNNLCKVVFADDAASAFATVTAANAPYTGTWQPRNPLSAVRANAVDGTWTFSAIDGVAGDAGSIRAVSLHINGFVQ
ncbi:S8 family serine peptidase [Amycolatopsis minnesotensis]|uniref:S8 family serine peptidase n=1 Tax=Amycolatopsis minnesotensis TaxID=337894 RepID=A0ABP5DBP3_9PSEU